MLGMRQRDLVLSHKEQSMDVTEYGCCNRLDASRTTMLSEHKSIPSDAHVWKHRAYTRATDYHESGNVSSTSSSTTRDDRLHVFS